VKGYEYGTRVERLAPEECDFKMRLNPTYPPGTRGSIVRYLDDGQPEPWDYEIRLDDGQLVAWNYQLMKVIKDDDQN